MTRGQRRQPAAVTAPAAVPSPAVLTGPAVVPLLKFAGLVRSGGRFGLLLLAAGAVVAVVGTTATQPGAVVGIASPPWAVELTIPVLRLLVDLGAVAVVGLSLLSLLIGSDRPDRSEPVLDRARRLAGWASVMWGVGALLSIVLLSVELDPARRVGPSSVWAYVANIATGKGLLISAGSAVLSLWLCRSAVRHGDDVPAELRIGVALFGLLPLPLTGHAADSSYHELSMLSVELHVVAASAWAGGLAALVLFLGRQPALLAVALPRFSTLATWCVVVVGLSGAFNGLLELALSPITQLPGSILSTRYGVLLIAKATCLAVVGAVALHVRRRILPRVEQGRSTAIVVWCGVELLFLAAAFGVAVVLTRSSVTPF